MIISHIGVLTRNLEMLYGSVFSLHCLLLHFVSISGICETFVSDGFGKKGHCTGDKVYITFRQKCEMYCGSVNPGCMAYTYEAATQHCYQHFCQSTQTATSSHEYYMRTCPDITTPEVTVASTSNEAEVSTNNFESTSISTVNTIYDETTSISTVDTIYDVSTSISTVDNIYDETTFPSVISTTDDAISSTTAENVAETKNPSITALIETYSSTDDSSTTLLSTELSSLPDVTTYSVTEHTDKATSNTETDHSDKITTETTTEIYTTTKSSVSTTTTEDTTNIVETSSKSNEGVAKDSSCTYPSGNVVSDWKFEGGWILCYFHYRKVKSGGVVLAPGLLFDEYRVSTIQCSSRCAIDKNCKSFYFHIDTKNCQGYSSDFMTLIGGYQLS